MKNSMTELNAENAENAEKELDIKFKTKNHRLNSADSPEVHSGTPYGGVPKDCELGG